MQTLPPCCHASQAPSWHLLLGWPAGRLLLERVPWLRCQASLWASSSTQSLIPSPPNVYPTTLPPSHLPTNSHSLDNVFSWACQVPLFPPTQYYPIMPCTLLAFSGCFSIRPSSPLCTPSSPLIPHLQLSCPNQIPSLILSLPEASASSPIFLPWPSV